MQWTDRAASPARPQSQSPALRCLGCSAQLSLPRKGLSHLASFLPHLCYQFKTCPSLWYWPRFAAPHCAPELEWMVLRWWLKTMFGLFSMSLRDPPYSHWAMELSYCWLLGFFYLVKIFHALIVPRSPKAASDKQLCEGHGLAGGTAASQRWVPGH